MATSPRPGRLDIDIIQGADWTLPLAVKNQTDALMVFTGWSAAAHVRGDIDDASPAITMAVTLGTFGTAPNQYNVECHIGQATSSAAADWGHGRWDLELTDDFGNVARVIEGVATLSREVTR